MNTKAKYITRIPHGFMPRLEELTGLTPPAIRKAIYAGNTGHKAWAAYEQLLKEAVAKKQAAKERIAKAQQLQAQIAA